MAGKEPAKVIELNKKNVAKIDVNASIIENNSSFVPSEPALDESRLQAAVSRIITHSGTYGETRHSKSDRAFRNISDDDIFCCLGGKWSLVGEPVWRDTPHRNWNYKISGTDIDGEELVLVIAINAEKNRITIITKY